MSDKIESANNIPVQFPTYMEPKVPYTCPDYRCLSVICEGSEEVIRRVLEKTPFEYVDNIYQIYVGDYMKCPTGAYMDSGIMIKVKYKNYIGGHILIEFEDHDYSIAAGRELWGYPKKFAHSTLEWEGKKLIGRCFKKENELIRIEMDTEKAKEACPDVSFSPHLQLQVIPRAEGPGIAYERILRRDTSACYDVKKSLCHPVKVWLSDDERTPMTLFSPIKILGAKYIEGEFHPDDVNGWAYPVETIINELK